MERGRGGGRGEEDKNSVVAGRVTRLGMPTRGPQYKEGEYHATTLNVHMKLEIRIRNRCTGELP